MIRPMGRPYEAALGDGNSGSPDITEVAVAERLRGAIDRDATPRLPGSCADLWRAAFATGAEGVLSLL